MTCGVHRQKCAACDRSYCMNEVTLLSGLSEKEMGLISKEAVTYQFKRGDIVFSEGEKANHLYIICKGKIKINRFTVDGKEQILYILSDGDFIGAFNLLKEDHWEFTAEALEDTTINTISKAAFDDVLIKSPEITIKVLEKAYERIRKVESLVNRLGTNNVDAKVAALLLNLESNFGHKTSKGTLLKLSINRDEMGAYAGIARETMTRKLKMFESIGLIKLVGTKEILILNKSALKEMN